MRFESRFSWVALALPLLCSSCAQEEYPQADWNARNRGWVDAAPPEVSSRDANDDVPEGSSLDVADASAPPLDVSIEPPTPTVDAGALDASVPETPVPPTLAACVFPVGASESLVARLAATSSTAPKPTRPIFVSDLFSLFQSNCGGCHVDGSSGGFHVSASDFSEKVNQGTVDRIMSTQPIMTMPPLNAGGKLASQRMPGDPVLELASLLNLWIAAGRPRDVFDVKNEASTGGGYILSAEAGDNMTNLGSCVPAKRIVATERINAEKLDTFFANLTKAPPGTGSLAERIGLPERLSQTDLTTFESETLARSGVIAFVPGYPLWSDGSGKLRHVRVPQGQSIRFNPTTQSFEIPANTRFYKTFLKRIVDVDNVISYRKIETRLIVTRRDIERPDGTSQVTALYGSYAWNEDETEATLVTDPLRNGEPFRDRLITYITDEPGAKSIKDQKPNNLTLALERANVIRRYAIPGSERCVQCHMGSPMGNFVLGFLPVQINRRNPGPESGAIEPTGDDELNQLQRLIDYGVVSGMTSPSEVLLLEQLEGTRKPRNPQELAAQGYMLGNCAHCHNPRGFPSVSAPVLSSTLNFLPSPKGGIFQFPLDKTSPRIFRGLNSNTPIPYITPSLMDTPPQDSSQPKWALTDVKDGLGFSYVLPAPWRSLIFRNVSTPFAYADDNALFPHMPMNVAGFDCRAPRILGEWMVSIPATWKDPATEEFSIRITTETTAPPGSKPDITPQPYVEVAPGEAGYAKATSDAEARITAFKTGKLNISTTESYSYYNYCPDTSDIVDREVLRNPRLRPVPMDEEIVDTSTTPPSRKMPRDAVPNRAHWVITDATEVLGDWNPRRSDWETILVKQQFPVINPDDYVSDPFYQLALKKQEREKATVAMLQNAGLDGIRSYATTPIPFGFWQKKANCNFDGIPTTSSFTGVDKPKWMESAAPDAPVYMQRPGEAVFNMICINCHGTNFDSLGRQAENLMLMTGGNARVANFRFGLFGPSTMPGANRPRVFGATDAGVGVTPDDMGARYMAWMALGGTSQTIPPAILGVVANTDVLGARREWSSGVSSANMLDTAKTLCGNVLGVRRDFEFNINVKPSPTGDLGFITTNGDADLWPILCSQGNPPPLRAVNVKIIDGVVKAWEVRAVHDLYPTDNYKDAPVVDHLGRLKTGIDKDNFVPWCIRQPISADRRKLTDESIQMRPLPGGGLAPYCPTSVVPATDGAPPAEDGHWSVVDDDTNTLWATRGAISVGQAIFLFLDDAISGRTQPLPRYDRCDLIKH